MSINSLESRALQLFDEYVDLPEARRSAALAALRQSEPALHDELARLLAADASGSLDTAPLELLARVRSSAEETAPADARLGMRLGAWRLDRIIGAGGMGTVYEAHRADGQYEQQVALKCLRTELATPRLLEAFRHERSTLAKLDHPYIARLLDGGVDDQGHPWFAMQKIDGEPIDRWCDRQRLPLRERVQLLAQSCEAVAYAHEWRVLHQDLKPSNLLVAADGRPMLLDFGLAQLLPRNDEPGRPRIGISNGYTAPEALRETAPSPATDVYAMGVILYRLLCSDWPVAPSAAGVPSPDLQAPAVPRVPSALALQSPPHVARARGESGPRALARRLAGDLDSIALRCVAVDPQNRYRTIDELQADLQRWLRKQPVRARNGGIVYLARRFVQRNALATALATVTVLALGGVAGFALWHTQHAHEDSALAKSLADLFQSIPGGAALPEWGQMPLNTPQALERSERGLRESPLRQDPRALARGLLTVARGYFAIGDQPHSLALVDEAKRLLPDDPRESARTQATLAGMLNAQSRYTLAEQTAREGVKVLGTPLSDDAKSVLANLYAEIARARWQQADRKAAQSLLDDTLREIASSPDRYPPGLRAALLTQRSDWRVQLHRFDEGKRDAESALAVAGASAHLASDAQAQIAAAQSESGDARNALATAQAVLQRQQRQYGQDHPEVGLAWIVLAEAQQAGGRPREALASSQQALRILTPVLGDSHTHIARGLRVKALAQTFLGAYPAAVADARRAVAIVEAAYGPRHEQSIRARQALALSLGYASEAEPQGSALLDEALAQYVRLLRDGENLGLPMSRQWLAYGIRLGNSGRVREARRALERALPQLRREYGEDSDYAFEARRSLATLLLKENRYADARKELEQFAVSLRQSKRDSLYRSVALSDTLLEIAQVDLMQERPDLARRHLEEALQLNLKHFGAGDVHSQAIQRALANLPVSEER